MDVPDDVVVLSTMLVGESVQVRPVEGETVAVMETVPVNPFCAVTVMVEVPVTPASSVTVVGFAVTA